MNTTNRTSSAYSYRADSADVDDVPSRFTLAEIDARLSLAEADMRSGNVHSCEDVHQHLEEKFPWLCK